MYRYDPFTCQEIELPKAALSGTKAVQKSSLSQQRDFCLTYGNTTASSPALHQFRLERDLSISSELKKPKSSHLEEPRISYVLVSYPVLPLNRTPGHAFDLGYGRIAARSLLRLPLHTSDIPTLVYLKVMKSQTKNFLKTLDPAIRFQLSVFPGIYSHIILLLLGFFPPRKSTEIQRWF